MSITQHLSDLCLAHAWILREYLAMAALLRRLEADTVDLEQRENKADPRDTRSRGACVERETPDQRTISSKGGQVLVVSLVCHHQHRASF
jgi:hypothetical protein